MKEKNCNKNMKNSRETACTTFVNVNIVLQGLAHRMQEFFQNELC